MLTVTVVLAAADGILALKSKLPSTTLFTHVSGKVCAGPPDTFQTTTTTIDGGGLQISASTINGGVCVPFLTLSE